MAFVSAIEFRMNSMMLQTLGRLELSQSQFRRTKPLVLLAYLAFEGSKPRRYVAEIFWPEASDPMNSLSVALSQLRKGAPDCAEGDEQRVWVTCDCDAVSLREHFAKGKLQGAIKLYAGPFLEGAEIGLGEELEEWLYETREGLAATVREALLRLAEDKAAQGSFEEAAKLAERAYHLAGAVEPEPEALVRFHALLVAGKSTALHELKEEAEAFDISLSLSPEEAQARLRQTIIGRKKEVQQLSGLAPGEWAWLRGAAGMGKTTLLKQLSGSYLPARAGLPYATLEPLLGDDFGDNESEILRRLAAMNGTWLFDDLEAMDPESQALLLRLRGLRPAAKIIATTEEAPPFRGELSLELGPLSQEELAAYPEALEQTGGLPELVGAYLREEPLEAALERRLASLSEAACHVYLTLSLAGEATPARVRRALGLSGSAIANALDELLTAGLIEASGQPRAKSAALEYLERRQGLKGKLALGLARVLSSVAAFPLYEQTRTLWEESDHHAVQEAYLAWADELLKRGFAFRASEILAKAPPSEALLLTRAQALERAGQFKEALEVLKPLPETPETSALKGALYWRLGQPDEARASSERALEGSPEARAEALNTLGHLARSQGDFEEAASYARRAAALWQTLNMRARWTDALNNLAVAKTLLGEKAEDVFQEALEVADNNLLLRARVLLNLGWMHEHEKQFEMARTSYEEAATLANQAGAVSTAAWAWNNLGVLLHQQNAHDDARKTYEQSLALAQQAGEQRILGMVMANLAELTENFEAWEEALAILEGAGHKERADYFRSVLPKDHPFRQYPEHGI